LRDRIIAVFLLMLDVGVGQFLFGTLVVFFGLEFALQRMCRSKEEKSTKTKQSTTDAVGDPGDTDEKTLVEWVSRVVSTIHAVLATTFGTICLYKATWREYDMFFGRWPWEEYTTAFTLAYIIHDLVMVIWFHNVLWDRMILAHHLVAIFSFSLGIYYSRGTFIMSCFIFNEISTPFLNKRWFLMKSGKYNSFEYKFYSLVFSLTFLLVRVVFNLYVLYRLWGAWRICWEFVSIAGKYPEPLITFMTFLALSHVFINLKWASIIVLMLLKTMGLKKDTRKFHKKD